jgi:hypothetical protein
MATSALSLPDALDADHRTFGSSSVSNESRIGIVASDLISPVANVACHRTLGCLSFSRGNSKSMVMGDLNSAKTWVAITRMVDLVLLRSGLRCCKTASKLNLPNARANMIATFLSRLSVSR